MCNTTQASQHKLPNFSCTNSQSASTPINFQIPEILIPRFKNSVEKHARNKFSIHHVSSSSLLQIQHRSFNIKKTIENRSIINSANTDSSTICKLPIPVAPPVTSADKPGLSSIIVLGSQLRRLWRLITNEMIEDEDSSGQEGGDVFLCSSCTVRMYSMCVSEVRMKMKSPTSN